MKSSDKELKKRLIRKRKNVKEKLAVLKHGEMAQEQIFLPITKHLENIQSELRGGKNSTTKSSTAVAATTTPKSSTHVKVKIKPEETNLPASEADDGASLLPYVETPKLRYTKRKLPVNEEEDGQDENPEVSMEKQSIIESINEEDDDDEFEAVKKRRQSLAEDSFADYLDQYESLPKKYIAEMYKDTQNKFDHKYGVRFEPETEKFYVGDSRMEIDGNDLVVKNKRYKGTQGLYELLFKKNPLQYTVDDERNYRQIIFKTNAHRRYFQSNKQVDGSKLQKYKTVIAPFVSGKGVLLEANKDRIDYVHWDDPNELVERLRLLLASQQAGHTGHINEINSIIEELKESHIIQ